MRIRTCVLQAAAAVLCAAVAASAVQAGQPAKRRTVCYGDSNTLALQVEPQQRWPAVLQTLMPDVEALNEGADSRTTGQESGARNGLEDIEPTLKRAGRADEVILMLGTNDAKGYLWQEGGGVQGYLKRMGELISKIKAYRPDGAAPPMVTVVTPPPLASKLEARFDTPAMLQNANPRIIALVRADQILAFLYQARFVNTAAALAPDIDKMCIADGVHLNADGQKRVAETIAAVLKDAEAPAPPSEVHGAVQQFYSLDATLASETTTLAWKPSPSTDIFGYVVLSADGRLLAYTGGTSATLAGRHQNVQVLARDAAANLSAPAKEMPSPATVP